MKVGVLEWVCGGGLSEQTSSQIQSELLHEGAAMLACLVDGFHAAGHQVSVPLDARLAGHELAARDSFSATSTELIMLPLGQPSDRIMDRWIRWAQSCDQTLIVAPECDGVLEDLLARLTGAGVSPINAQGSFLVRSADKLATSQVLAAAELPHPPTVSAAKLTERWCRDVQASVSNEHWVVKPRWGAGGDGLSIFDDNQLSNWLRSQAPLPSEQVSAEQHASEQFVVQPRISGQAYSCSAIVDAAGRPHWLPLVTQEFDNSPARQVTGAQLVDVESRLQAPGELLDRAWRALGTGASGWVGFDLHFDPSNERWTIIEVNPRCTTSIQLLQRAYSGNLVAEILAAQHSSWPGLQGHW